VNDPDGYLQGDIDVAVWQAAVLRRRLLNRRQQKASVEEQSFNSKNIKF
jgi:hypothetical protein